MDYNYHTHTYRCGHATGTEEEYVLRAIEGGIKRMGFSEHAPFVLPDGTEHYYRLPSAQIGEYFSTVRALREKYADKIEIHIGFEMEYYAEQFDEMLRLAVESGAEYLILGQHQIEILPEYIHCYNEIDDRDMLRRFVDLTVAAMRTGVFSYVAHPDLIKFVGDEEIFLEETRRICEESLALGLPLELNFLGIRTNRVYPRESFWRMVGEMGAPVTFGFDAHDTEAAYDGESLKRALEMVEKFGLNYIGEPRLIPLTYNR